MSNSRSNFMILVGVALGLVLLLINPFMGLVVLLIGAAVVVIIKLILLRPRYRCLTCARKFKTSREMINHAFKTGHDTKAKYYFSSPSEIGVKFEGD